MASTFGFSAKTGLLVAALLLPLAANAAPAVSGVWIRLAAVADRPAGGYFEAQGDGKNDALTSVTSPVAERIELHRMVMNGSMARMEMQKSFPLPANGRLSFAPGGSHLMIFGLAAGLKAGERIPLVFHFQSGDTVSVEAELRSPAAAAGGMGGMTGMGGMGGMPASGHAH